MSHNLWQCWECGRPISKSASSCPNCGTSRPFGMACKFCGKLARVSELVQVKAYGSEIERGFPQKLRDFDYVVPLHESCYRLIFPSLVPDALPCPDCNASIRLDEAARRSEEDAYWLPCPYCGLPDPLHSLRYCSYCSLLIIPGYHVFRERRRRDPYSSPIRYHQACADQSGENRGCALIIIVPLLVPISHAIFGAQQIWRFLMSCSD